MNAPAGPSVLNVAMALALVASTMVAPASPPPQWSVVMTVTEIGYGVGIPVFVSGPAGGAFNVTMTTAPFNYTFPAFYESYVLPNGTNASSGSLGSGLAYDNFTIPTGGLYLGAWQVLVQAQGLAFHNVVRIVDPVNATALQQEISAQNTVIGQLVVQLVSQESALALAQQATNGARVAAYIMAGALAFVGFLVVTTKTAAKNTRIGKRTARFLRWLEGAMSTSGFVVDQDLVDGSELWAIPEAPKDALFRATCGCGEYSGKRTPAEIERHYRGYKHRRRDEVRYGADYVFWNERRTTRAPPEPTPSEQRFDPNGFPI